MAFEGDIAMMSVVAGTVVRPELGSTSSCVSTMSDVSSSKVSSVILRQMISSVVLTTRRAMLLPFLLKDLSLNHILSTLSTLAPSRDIPDWLHRAKKCSSRDCPRP